ASAVLSRSARARPAPRTRRARARTARASPAPSSLLARRDLAVQPTLGELPAALDRAFGQPELVRRLLDGEAAEDAQLDDAREIGRELGELGHDVIDFDQVVVAFLAGDRLRVE